VLRRPVETAGVLSRSPSLQHAAKLAGESKYYNWRPL